MARQTINLGSSPNKGDGDPLRLAFQKINSNFEELYANSFAGGPFVGDLVGSVFADDSSILVDGVNGSLHGDLYGSVLADDSTVIINGLTGEIPGYVSIAMLQDIAAQSTDFNDFKARIANL